MGTSSDEDRAVVNGAASVSALRASLPSAARSSAECAERLGKLYAEQRAKDGCTDIVCAFPHGGNCPCFNFALSLYDHERGDGVDYYADLYAQRCGQLAVAQAELTRLTRGRTGDLIEIILYAELEAREAGHGYASREWASYIAQAIEAGTAEMQGGSVHESAAAESDAPENPKDSSHG